jgi:hypothetical protein
MRCLLLRSLEDIASTEKGMSRRHGGGKEGAAIKTSVTVAEKYGGFSMREGTLSKKSGGKELPSDSMNSSRRLCTENEKERKEGRRDRLCF